MKRLLLLSLCLIGALSLPVQAAKNLTKKEYQQLMLAHKAYGEEDYKAAAAQMVNYFKLPLKNYAKAHGYQMRGNIALAREDYPAAYKDLERAYKLKQLSKEEQRGLMRGLAQLSYQNGDWQKTADWYGRWFKAGGKPSADDYLMLGQSYSELQRWKPALKYIQRAIASRKKVPESWYQLQLNAHWKLGQFGNATALLEKLIKLDPNNSFYWQQLAAGYQQQDKPDRVLAALRGGYLQGAIRSAQHITWLGQLMMQQGSPQRGAELLEQAMSKGLLPRELKTQQLLSQAYLMARNYRQATPLLQTIAQQTGSAMSYQQLGQANMQLKRWQQARSALASALAKGAANPGRLHLMMGMASLNDSRLPEARTSFERAAGFSSVKGSANTWLKYIDEITEQRQKLESHQPQSS